MESQEVRRTLSKVKTNTHKPESVRSYYFYCWFDPAVRIRQLFREARQHCNPQGVDLHYQSGLDAAIIVGRGAYEDQNKRDVECVHAYFLEHGWKEEEGTNLMKKGSVLRFFNNAYVNGILVGILLLFATSLYTSFTSKVDFGKALVFVVTFGVPIWIMVALFALILVVSKILARYRRPAHLRYVKDEIRGVTLRWAVGTTCEWLGFSRQN